MILVILNAINNLWAYYMYYHKTETLITFFNKMTGNVIDKEKYDKLQLSLKENLTKITAKALIIFIYMQNVLKNFLMVSSILLCYLYFYHPGIFDHILLYAIKSSNNHIVDNISTVIQHEVSNIKNSILPPQTAYLSYKTYLYYGTLEVAKTTAALLIAGFIFYKCGIFPKDVVHYASQQR